jgi:ribonuclease Z
MAKIVVLGSANSVPDETHENTHLMVVTEERTVLVDCVGNPIPRLHKARVDFNIVSDLILTHFHPDHVAGVPLLLMDLWLMGRKAPMTIYGLAYTLERAASMMHLYEWETWPNFFPVVFKNLPEVEMAPVLDYPDLRVFSSPVRHMIPNIGLRFEFPLSQRMAAYSSDTAPCPEVARLAQGVDVLIHEATGASNGHSSAAQAGALAREAGARQLVLIHYTVRGDLAALRAEAVKTFGGPVCVAQDFQAFDL